MLAHDRHFVGFSLSGLRRIASGVAIAAHRFQSGRDAVVAGQHDDRHGRIELAQAANHMAQDQKTDMATVEKEIFRSVRPTSLLKRFATPEEVAALVVFVCSPLSSATNGAALRADGGVVRSIL